MAVQKENKTPDHDSAAADKRTNDCSSNDLQISTKRCSQDEQLIALTSPMKRPRMEATATPTTPQVVFSAQSIIHSSPLIASKGEGRKESPVVQQNKNGDYRVLSESSDKKSGGDEQIWTPLVPSSNQSLNSLLASR